MNMVLLSQFSDFRQCNLGCKTLAEHGDPFTSKQPIYVKNYGLNYARVTFDSEGSITLFDPKYDSRSQIQNG